jgi:peroxiredoxin
MNLFKGYHFFLFDERLQESGILHSLHLGRTRPGKEVFRGLVLFFCLFPSLAVESQAENRNPGQVLKQTEEFYKNLRFCFFSGYLQFEWQGSGPPQHLTLGFQYARAENGRLRLQRGWGASKILAVTNGNTSTIYVADNRQYQIHDSGNLLSILHTALEVEKLDWIMPFPSFLEPYESLAKKFHNPRILDEQEVLLDGKRYPCLVVEGDMEPREITSLWGTRRTQLWIDQGNSMVRREVSFPDFGLGGGKGESLKTEMGFYLCHVNEPLPEELFVLNLPQGVEKVERFVAPQDPAEIRTPAGPLRRVYYQLPFLAMKSFRLQTYSGEEISLEQLRGKLVLLDFWATWCLPCHKQMEDLAKILKKYKGKEIVVLGLNNEDLVKTRDFLASHSPAYPMLMDLAGNVSSLYGVNTLPTLILLDREGRILIKREKRQTLAQIESLLKEAGL